MGEDLQRASIASINIQSGIPCNDRFLDDLGGGKQILHNVCLLRKDPLGVKFPYLFCNMGKTFGARGIKSEGTQMQLVSVHNAS